MSNRLLNKTKVHQAVSKAAANPLRLELWTEEELEKQLESCRVPYGAVDELWRRYQALKDEVGSWQDRSEREGPNFE